MRVFAHQFRVDLHEAEGQLTDYRTFGQFFTRRLKPGLRPIDPAPDAITSPVDGTVSQAGLIEQGACLQAKGITFRVDQLLGDARQALAFEGGSFTTIYLSPRDYHRIHAPVAGRITGYGYLPGAFWPVNPASVRTQQALFAINERLVTYVESAFGRVAIVAVGATCVARIHASYDSIVTHTGESARQHTYERPIAVEKGGEIGMFEMGSTVILLFERNRVKWAPTMVAAQKVKLGERIGVGA
jgi:phosphatidylserine decarboxylase